MLRMLPNFSNIKCTWFVDGIFIDGSPCPKNCSLLKFSKFSWSCLNQKLIVKAPPEP